jgi:hypothetical protein
MADNKHNTVKAFVKVFESRLDTLWKDQPFRFDWEADLPKGRTTVDPSH